MINDVYNNFNFEPYKTRQQALVRARIEIDILQEKRSIDRFTARTIDNLLQREILANRQARHEAFQKALAEAKAKANH